MRGKLLIQNETDYDGRSVNAIIRWVFKQMDLTGPRCVVKVKHHRGRYAYKGRFYSNAHGSGGYVYDWRSGDWKDVAPSIPDTHVQLIVCRIGRPEIYPCRNHVYDRKDSPGTWIVADWKEALVCIAAHEVTHLRQYVKPRRRYRGRYNEVETEWAAFRLWRRWRAKEGRVSDGCAY